MRFIYLFLYLSLFVCCVWGAPPRCTRVLQPISVLDANIPRHLPGTRKAILATPREKARQRPGRKPKALEDRVYKARDPIRRVERSYSREKKVEVLMFLTHHRVPKFDDEDDRVEYRPPRQASGLRFHRELLLSGGGIVLRLLVKSLALGVSQMHHGYVYDHSWRLLYLSAL